MKINILIGLIVISFITACVSIPQETITLSKQLGTDLNALHNSHRNIIHIYYGKVKDDINEFINDVYAPYIIHYVLKIELDKFKKEESSLYGSIELAGQKEGKAEAEEALNVMMEFQEAVREQIESKRNELLAPIFKQEDEVLTAIDKSYANTIYANTTITGYLESVKSLKESQKKAMSAIGLNGADSLVTSTLIKMSETVKEATQKGRQINIKSDSAYKKIEDISNKIKGLTKKP